MSDSLPKLRVRSLKKSFDSNLVLDGVDLDLPAGRLLVVIGGSGSGKSVLLKCILGLLTPDAGSIAIDGIDLAGLDPRARAAARARIGMLFQNGALFDSLPVWENVMFGSLARRAIGRAQARRRAVDYLHQVGLGPRVAGLYPAELSGGMQRRVALARAIANQPDILFFDEPTTGLDPIVAAVIDELMVETLRQLGSSGIAITHDMRSASRIGDRAAMIHAGRIVWTGPARELMTTDNPFVSQFTHGRRDGPIRIDPAGAEG